MNAICIRCGTSKRAPWLVCRTCRLRPVGEDLVKSVYCSVGRFESADEQAEYRAALERHRETLRSGGSIAFDEGELDRLRRQSRLTAAVRARRVWGAVFRFFLPGIAFLGLLFGLVALLKHCH